MNLEQQCIGLDLAKRLKELGIMQESLFYHYNEPYDDGRDDWVITTWEDYEDACPSKTEPFSAFTVAELGEMLPIAIPYLEDGEDDVSFLLTGKNQDGKWFVNYTYDVTDESEANARALILIYLIEQGLVKP